LPVSYIFSCAIPFLCSHSEHFSNHQNFPPHLSNVDPLRAWAIRRLVYSGSSALFEKLKPLRDEKSEDSAATGKRDSNYQEFNGQ